MNLPNGVYSLSSLGRSIELQYRSNALTVAVSFAVAVLVGSYNLVADQPLEISGFAAAIGVFLAWAIGRELDPDHTASAALAMGVSLGVAVFAAPSLLAGTGILIATRLLTGSVGAELRGLDPVVLVLLGGLLGAGPTSPAVVPALIVGILVAGNRTGRSIVIAAATGIAAVVALLVRHPLIGPGDPDGLSIVMLIATVVALAMSIPAESPTSETDLGHKSLFGWRITASRVAVAATIGAAFAIGGSIAVQQTFVTGGAALAGVALVRMLRRPGR
jgi:hypothetical protein